MMRQPRVSIPPDGWSATDQAALHQALAPGSRREGTGRGSQWRPATVSTNCESVSYFAGFLANKDVDVRSISLSNICTDQRVWDWIDVMKDRKLAAATIKMRVVGLQRLLAVMYPRKSWRWLREIINELPDGRLESRRRKVPLVKHCRELLALGYSLIAEAETRSFLRPYLRHVQVRDGLIIVFLALRPLRRRNVTNLRLGVHLFRQSDGTWRLFVPAAETKNRETIDMYLRDDLGHLLDRYLAVDWPALLARRIHRAPETEDHLWLTEDGTPIAAHTLKEQIRARTKQEFGVAISPHRFRDAVATTASIEIPKDRHAARALLADRDPRTIQHHYDQADSLIASRKVNDAFAVARDRLRQMGLIR